MIRWVNTLSVGPPYLSMPIEVPYTKLAHRSFLGFCAEQLLVHICPLERSYVFVFQFCSMIKWCLRYVQVPTVEDFNKVPIIPSMDSDSNETRQQGSARLGSFNKSSLN